MSLTKLAQGEFGEWLGNGNVAKLFFTGDLSGLLGVIEI
jgi:hypothetical protein